MLTANIKESDASASDLAWVYTEPRSEIERFARAYWCGAFNEKNLVVSLIGYSAYFDCSRDDPAVQPNGGTVVAGFISTIEQWAFWEAEWKAALKEFDVPYFHMKEFLSSSSRGPFAAPEWRIERHRRNFIARLATIIKTWTIASVADHIEHQMYQDANILCEIDSVFNAFAECGRNCALQAKRFIREGLGSTLPIAYFFDQGDQGGRMLTDMMRQCNLPDPAFKRSRPDPMRPELDMDNPPMIQLQAADLLAWEIRKWKNDYRDGKRMRKSLQSFFGTGHNIWKECTYEDMAKVIHSIGIPRRKQKP